MTLLQQTCYDMLSSQERLQVVYAAEHSLRRSNAPAEVRESVRQAKVFNERLGRLSSDMLAVNFPAANDATTLPGAA